MGKNKTGKTTVAFLIAMLAFGAAIGEWKVSFDTQSQTFAISSTDAEISLKAAFEPDSEASAKVSAPDSGKPWLFSASRDAVKDRYCLVNPAGDVQGYLRFTDCKDTLEILFLHRSAQNFGGKILLSGRAILKDARTISVRIRPSEKENVLNLNLNGADSPNQDALFAPNSDTLLGFDAENLRLENLQNGNAAVFMECNVLKPKECAVKISLYKNYLKNRYIPYFKAMDFSRIKTAPSGWMSWNTYFDKATAEDNLAEARIGKEYLQPFGCEIWSIESWQGNSDKLPVRKFYNVNLETNPKQFPEGMAKLAKDIRALGFKAGLWVAPFATGNTEFYQNHKDWFLHDASGNPISCWNGIYTLDPTNDEVLAHLEKIFRIASRDWGYEFFKIDGMSGRNKGYCAHMFERPEIRAAFKNPQCENPFERCVQAFRRGIGKSAVFLACQGHSTGPEAAYADAARSGADIVHPNKPVTWNNVKNQAVCTANQIYAHNISMILDPDTLLVKDLPIEEARVSATLIALPGQLTFFGDKLAKLNEEQMGILQKTLPPVRARPSALYPYFEIPEIWLLSQKSGVLGARKTAALFNFSDVQKTVSATAQELGLDPKKSYAGFEFWTQSPVEDLSMPVSWKIPAHSVRVIGIVEKSEIPQWAGSDRHISLAGNEIEELKWDDATNTLVGKIAFAGDFKIDEFFSIPSGLKFVSASCKNAEISTDTVSGSFLKLSIKPLPVKKSDASAEEFQIRFEKE